jgi:hypothetical protein
MIFDHMTNLIGAIPLWWLEYFDNFIGLSLHPRTNYFGTKCKNFLFYLSDGKH